MKFDYKKIWQWLKYIILGGFIVKKLFSVLKKDAKKIEENFEDFLDEEKKEAEELANGKESFQKYFQNTCSIFKVYFIPAECNEYKPKILRTKSLAIIAVILILFKALIVSYLFFIYPNVARMSEIISQEIYNLVNNERTGNNLNALIFNDKLNIAAQAKANDMVKNNYFAHKSPDGKMPWDWIDRNEYAYLYAGENLAMNFTSAFSAHQALIMSESHKKNILNSRYSDIGIAMAKGVINGRETNVLVELFGSAKSAVKPALAKETIKENQNIKIDANKQGVSENTAANKEKQLEVLSSEVKNNAAVEEPTGAEPAPQESAKSTNTAAIIANTQGEGLKQVAPIINIESESNLAGMASEVNLKNYQNLDFIGQFIFYSQYIFLAALVIMTLLLLINIFVKISVQHKPLIVQTLLVIVMIIGLLSVKIHFLEGISQKIIIF
jgi:hypothetical protein